MRKLYYLACGVVLSGLAACEVPPLADGSSAVTVEGVATAPVSHTIPAAKALEHLAGALVALDGPTRSPGESRTVQRVTAVTRADLRASATRSVTYTPPQVFLLFYGSGDLEHCRLGCRSSGGNAAR